MRLTRAHRAPVRLAGVGLAVLAVLASAALSGAAPRATYDSQVATLVGRVSQTELRNRLTWLESFGTRFYTSAQCAQAAEGIRQYFVQLGLTTTIQNFTIPGRTQTFTNVIATIPGRRDPSRIYLLGAHYDSISNRPSTSAPGADDNASGTSALMEIARVLSTYTFDYTITFVAFGAEEAGLYGSAAYASAARQRGDQIAGMLNLDMIAYVDQPGEDLNLGINNASRWLADAFAATSPLYVPLSVSITNSGDSDHESFWTHGYSAILIIDDDPVTNPHYHRVTDTSSTLDFAFMTQMTQATLAVLADFARPIASTDAATASVSPSRLYFGGVVTNGSLSPLTSGQSVTLSFTGSGTPSWTVTADQPWIIVSGGAGTGSGRFTVSVVSPAPLPAGWAVAGTVTITGTGIANAPVTIPVVLTMYPQADARAPIGMVDTPVQGVSNVVGTIGVTGWALDEIDLAWVRVYRNCLPFEPAGNCQLVDGTSVVYIGDATRVEGARPDVQQQAPTYPHAHKAGWGYLLLTNLLPHVPTQQMFGGQGPITLYVRARDVDGHEVWLGRTSTDTVPTSMIMANDTIAVPFGAIDTPAQGATVSGTVANFGWVLTPDMNTTSGEAGDILVPTNGSTLRVYIDGVAGATIAYNQCRGVAASGPVPPGVFCDDDVANIFGNPAPAPALTSRNGNPTVFRNLDAGRGAIGALLLDTRTLTNGVHTIMWGVTDSNGRGEGIGSRYFTVLNGGADAPATEGPRAPGSWPKATDARPSSEAYAPRARTGLDLWRPWIDLQANEDGVCEIRLQALGRLELDLGPGLDGGALIIDDMPHALPVGSHLDRDRGLFSWAPGVGYLGPFRLAFERAGSRTVVVVTIGP